MTNFTELFATTLNATITAMVAEAVKKVEERYETQIMEMQGRIQELEDNATTPPDIDGDIERYIENYDFSTIVSDAIDVDTLFEGREFSSAVCEVIANSLTGARY